MATMWVDQTALNGTIITCAKRATIKIIVVMSMKYF